MEPPGTSELLVSWNLQALLELSSREFLDCWHQGVSLDANNLLKNIQRRVKNVEFHRIRIRLIFIEVRMLSVRFV